MKKVILSILLISAHLFGFKSDVKQIFAIGVFNQNGIGENIQNVKKTKKDYNGICFTKIYLKGNNFNIKPKVMIGDSIGKFVEAKPVFNKKILIGKIITFKHTNVTNGLLKVYFRKKLFDARVYIR